MKKNNLKKETETKPALTQERMARALVKYLRISPRKMRLVINAVRYKSVPEAFHVLMTLKKKAARMTEKALKTAAANAKVLGMDEKKLYVAKVWADGAPVMKRFMARSMGRADRILKRSTHLTVILKEADRTLSSDQETVQTSEAKSGKNKTISKAAAKAGSKKKAASGAAV